MFWAFTQCPENKWSVLTSNIFAGVDDDDDTDKVFSHLPAPQLLQVAEEYRPSQHPNSPIRSGRPVRQQYPPPRFMQERDREFASKGSTGKPKSGKQVMLLACWESPSSKHFS